MKRGGALTVLDLELEPVDREAKARAELRRRTWETGVVRSSDEAAGVRHR